MIIKPFAPRFTSGGISLKKGNFKKKLASLIKGGSPTAAGQVGLFIVFLFTIYYLRPSISLAQTFDSNSYHIDFGNFNMTSGKKSSANYTLTDTVGQNAPGQYDSTGYIVKAGFQYLYEQNIPLSFIVSNLDLNFGSLTPNVGSTVTNTLTISTPTGHGYDILVVTNHPLKSIGSNSTIPDTKCDSGTCSESVSGVWTSNSTNGFGFNVVGVNSSMVVTGVGTSNYFTDSTYFRQFADASVSETAKIIMSEPTPVKDHSALVTYKINISPNQPAGTYQNSINYIAVPKY